MPEVAWYRWRYHRALLKVKRLRINCRGTLGFEPGSRTEPVPGRLKMHQQIGFEFCSIIVLSIDSQNLRSHDGSNLADHHIMHMMCLTNRRCKSDSRFAGAPDSEIRMARHQNRKVQSSSAESPSAYWGTESNQECRWKDTIRTMPVSRRGSKRLESIAVPEI